ncbi:hypothetical protein FHS19_003250 [Paenibacillus rhizosphaerae]|uniref:Uncharacterized protein n=1 Tax=Paenibacillus rhizosphaerae TaxID=297318 RepID=A0A839TP57_9BACL|nr:hypothetical protein [Paenibacillus rhizosphaerae]MBB3128596.1 hypothetical protein [Paenibacillus rhizosphaerae]
MKTFEGSSFFDRLLFSLRHRAGYRYIEHKVALEGLFTVKGEDNYDKVDYESFSALVIFTLLNQLIFSYIYHVSEWTVKSQAEWAPTRAFVAIMNYHLE